jgi:uncharacterized protein (UPF0335 family)
MSQDVVVVTQDDIVREYVERKTTIETEIKTLQEDLRELATEFKDKVDVAVLNAALKIKRREDAIRSKAADTYDNLRISLDKLR